MSSREIINILEKNGWNLVRVNGSHHVFRHKDFSLGITVPHPRKDLPKGLVAQILRKAQIKL